MAEPLNLDLRGLLGVRAQLALATLPPQLRRRLLNNALKRVRAQARRNVSGQASPDGSPFPPRKRKGRHHGNRALADTAARRSDTHRRHRVVHARNEALDVL